MKNITISMKLGISFTIVILLFLIGMWISVIATQQLSHKSEDFFQNNHTRQQAYQTMFADGLLSGIALRNLVLRPELQKPFTVVPKAISRFDEALRAAESLAKDNPTLQASLQIIEQHWALTRQAKLDALEAMKKGNRKAAEKILVKREHPQWQKVRIQVQKLVMAEEKIAESIKNEIITEGNSATRNSLIFALIIIALAITVGFSITRTIKKTFSEIITSMDNIANGEGDLTRRLNEKGKDEAAQLAGPFNVFVKKIQQTVSEARKSGLALTSSAEKLSGISHEAKQNIQQQETKINEVATAINEMESTMQEVSRHADEASTAAQQANTESMDGQKVVTDVITSISDLATEFNSTSAIIKTLDHNADQIGGVLDVIKGIAEQTNLLALNAAIEAARAGEQGRGFAVVADEVRTLASRTQASTQEIETMIEKLQSGAKSAVKAMERGEEKNQSTVDKAQSAGEALNEITTAVSKIVDMNTQISNAVSEQSTVTENVNRNIVEISNLSKHSAEGADNTASYSQDVSRLAADIGKVMGSFKI